MKKATPWLHPRELRYQSPSYRAISRQAAAAMIRDHKKRREMYVKLDIYGRCWYVLTSERFILAEICVARQQPFAEITRTATRNSEDAFSWISTGKVCQKWSAYYASLPGELGANAT